MKTTTFYLYEYNDKDSSGNFRFPPILFVMNYKHRPDIFTFYKLLIFVNSSNKYLFPKILLKVKTTGS